MYLVVIGVSPMLDSRHPVANFEWADRVHEWLALFKVNLRADDELWGLAIMPGIRKDVRTAFCGLLRLPHVVRIESFERRLSLAEAVTSLNEPVEAPAEAGLAETIRVMGEVVFVRDDRPSCQGLLELTGWQVRLIHAAEEPQQGLLKLALYEVERGRS